MSKDLRTALNSPTEELWLGETENPIAPIKVESIPAQIIMGRTYAKQFGLRSGDSIYKIRQEGFWEERYKDRFLVSTNHELLVEKKADIVVFDGSGKRIFIKYDALGDFKPEGLTKSTSFVENSEGVLYYNGEEFIESDSIRTYSYQTITGSTEDVIVINNLDDLQKIKDAGFDVVQFNFTEDNYRYLLPVRYDFDKSAEHYLWDAGKRTDISITRDSINNNLTKLLIPQLNASEQSSIMHLISKKLKRMSQNFEKSLEFIGTRIPCQSMQSFMACKVIAFTDVEKNEIFIPAKLAWIQGSDYDIDKLYLTGRIFGDNGTLYNHLNKNPKLRAIGLKNKIVDGL